MSRVRVSNYYDVLLCGRRQVELLEFVEHDLGAIWLEITRATHWRKRKNHFNRANAKFRKQRRGPLGRIVGWKGELVVANPNFTWREYGPEQAA